MGESTPSEAESPQARGRTATIVRNVFANWIWYVIVVVSGFILPRFIDREVGQALLGVWDFGWSLVFYVSLLALGITSAVQRYVAKYRASKSWDDLNSTVSTCLAMLTGSAVLGGLAAIGLAMSVPFLLPTDSIDLGTVTQEQLYSAAVWVVLLLASTAALEMPASVFSAIITGYERYDLLNIIRGLADTTILVASISVLVLGYGIVAMAWIQLLVQLCSFSARFLVARRLCPTLEFSPAHINKETFREMLLFAGKTFTQNLSRMGCYQVNTFLVGYFLGPQRLAIYARQRALVMHMMRFVKQYAQVFIPSSSTLAADNDTKGLRELLVATSKFGLYVTLPGVALMCIMGGPLLELWMGSSYEAPVVLAIMAAGHLFSVPQQGVYSILMGMGNHGRPAKIEFVAFVIGVIVAFVILGPLDGGMIGAAVALSVPIAINGGVIVPVYACKLLKLPLSTYVRQVSVGPVLASLPFIACLLASKMILPHEPILSLLWGLSVGGVVWAVIFWVFVIPAPIKGRLTRRLVRSKTAGA